MVGEHTPRLQALAAAGSLVPMSGVTPAVTSSAQATMLTGRLPQDHGIVGNGWLFRETGEIRFWQQSRRLVQAPMLPEIARDAAQRRGQPFACAKLFWWYNQGAAANWSLTPKPWYGCDGDKRFGIHGEPAGFAPLVESRLGRFPFHTFWGPMADAECTEWIARATALVLREQRPDLTLSYLPHLDYDLQRFGVHGDHVPAALKILDDAAGVVLEAAAEVGAEVLAVSEYGLRDVSRPVFLNRILREAGWLVVRDGPFGETIETFQSRAVAVVDHQVAHVYVRDQADADVVAAYLRGVDGVGVVWAEDEKRAAGLAHERAGDLVVLSDSDAWFAYPYWLDEARAPDFAPTVDIHRKPGYDPAELFFDPSCWWPKARVAGILLRRWLGFRTRFSVISTDASRVRGSHGLPPVDARDGAVAISSARTLPEGFAMTDVCAYALDVLGLQERMA